MKLLSALLLLATPAMLAVHLASYKLVQQWYAPSAGWVARRLPPMCVLRLEAAYWIIVLLAWPIWGSPAMKAIVAAFAGIHLLGWALVELKRRRPGASLTGNRSPRTVALAVAAFDFVEAFALLAVGWYALAYLLRT